MIIEQPKENENGRWKVVQTSDEDPNVYSEMCPCADGHATADEAMNCPSRLHLQETKRTPEPTCGCCPFAVEVPGMVAQRECRGGPPVMIQHPDGSFVSVNPRVGADRPACGFSLFACMMRECVEGISESTAAIAEALEAIQEEGLKALKEISEGEA